MAIGSWASECLRAAMVVGALGAIGCAPDSVFFCQTLNDCGADGRCEDDGFCTFVDDTCPSGRRYGDLAGAGKAGTCFVEDLATGTSDEGIDDTNVDSETTTDAPASSGTTGPPLREDSTGMPADGSTGPQSSDGTTGLGEGLVDVDGEIIEVLPGWSGGVWYDLSNDFDFNPLAYDDPPVVFSNAPFSIVALADPFAAGLGLISVHTIIELNGDDYTERLFFQTKANGPDALWDAVGCSDWSELPPGLCVGSGSQGVGDGLFHIDADWTITQIDSTNNFNGIGFDPDGEFDGLGFPQLYSGTPNGISAHPGKPIVSGDFRNLLLPRGDRLIAVRYGQTGDDLISIAGGNYSQELLRSEPHPKEPINFQHSGAIKLVDGSHSGIEGTWFALVQTQALYTYDEGGSESQIAATVEGQGWRWVAAVVPDDAHPLADEGPTIYILEANRDEDRDRVIWLRPS